jgi:predicted enzyme related to lactoylglutathione lyase
MIYSEAPDKLAVFYEQTLGFKLMKKLTFPKDYGYNFEIAPGYELWLAKHDNVHGRNTDYDRNIYNIYCTSVDEAFARVASHPEVTIILPPTCMNEFQPDEVRYVATILDPEGNSIQFMGPK